MNLKNNKGFSLIELLVAMGLIAILTGIAVPAYKNYRESANDTVLKSDIGNGYKAMHAYNAVNNTYCADLDALGLKAIKASATYTESDDYFVGFIAGTNGGCVATDNNHNKKDGTAITATSCTLEKSSFVLGVANTFGDTTYGYNISHDDNSPKAKAGGTCSNTHCTNKGDCENAYDGAANCGGTTGTKSKWTPGTTIGDLCDNS